MAAGSTASVDAHGDTPPLPLANLIQLMAPDTAPPGLDAANGAEVLSSDPLLKRCHIEGQSHAFAECG